MILIGKHTSTHYAKSLTLPSVWFAGAEGETPCRAKAGVESEEKSFETVDLPTHPTSDGLR